MPCDPALYIDFKEKVDEILEELEIIHDGSDDQRLDSAITIVGLAQELRQVAEQLQ